MDNTINVEHKVVKRQSPYRKKSSTIVLLGIFAIIFSFAFYLVYVLYDTTVVNYDTYARAASNNQWKMMTYTSNRGVIYDANGNPLASNTYNYTIVCTPNSVVRSEGITRDEIINGFCEILGMNYADLDKKLPVNPDDANDPRNAVMGCDIKKNVEVETKEALERFVTEHNILGIGYVAVPQRYYNYGSLASQIVGYASNNGEALAGVYGRIPVTPL